MGHVFGLIPVDRNQAVEYSLGKHCANICSMRQGLAVPDDWIRMSNERLRYGSLCNLCRKDLVSYFR